MLAFHLKGTTRSGRNQWKATHQNVMEIMRTIKPYLPPTFRDHNVATDPVLLFHGKPGTSIESDLHEACNGHPKTLTLVKIKNGNIFGRLFRVRWSSYPPNASTPFMFLIGLDGQFQRLPLEKADREVVAYQSHVTASGLNFSSFMKDFAMVAGMHKDIFLGFNGVERRAFIKQLSAGGSDCGAIEYIK
ncbi:hypothetical protein HDU80_003367, partial [Chytriomyces hyalinus]